MRYNYIAIEGNIGAGKTTLATKIAQEYNARLILEQFEENSFLPKFYENPSKYAFPLELSFLAERYQQLKEQLGSHDLFSNFTISDYFINKSLIFAGKTLDADEYTLYTKLFHIINSVIPKPELLVYLYVQVDRLKRNIMKRGRTYEQNIESDYLERIQSGYLDYIKQQQGMRVLILDTNRIDFVASRKDYENVVDLIGGEYEPGITLITLG